MSNQALERVLKFCAAVAVAGVALVANAAPQAENTAPLPPNNSAADEQPPPQELPSCQPGEAAVAPTPPPPPPMAAEPSPAATRRRHNIVFAPQEVTVTTGAGVSNYFGTPITGATDVGAAWDARLTFGARSVLALEAAYIGASNTVDTGVGGHGNLLSQGLDSDLRLQVPTVVQPYIFGGVGYNHMSVTNTQQSTVGPLSSSADQLTVPAGAGLTGYIGRHATVDLRGTYRFIPDNGILIMNNGASLHQWVAQAHVGYYF